MTQSTEIREYAFDVIGRLRSPDNPSAGITPQNAGHVHVIVDDVQKRVTAKFFFDFDIPKNFGAKLYVGRSEQEKLAADLASHGINALPFSTIIYGSPATVNFLTQIDRDFTSLADIGFAKEGTSRDPGVRFYFEGGRVEFISNEAEPSGVSLFGNAPRSAGYDDVAQAFFNLDPRDYPQRVGENVVVVIPYA